MRKLISILFFVPILTFGQFYDGSNMQFGKNRIQYDNFEWQYYRFPSYETYFYTGGKEIAIHASKTASKYIMEYEEFLDFYNHEKIKYIIYNKYHHWKQSNIGMSGDENSMVDVNLGGVNKVIGTKVFIYFEGDHQLFEREIKAGTIEVLLGNFLYGGDWRSVLRNSEMYRMPDWYFSGMVSYLTDSWNSEINDIVKDAALTGKYEKIGRLENQDALVAGHSVWHYIAETYGRSVIPNILYVSKINKDVESGFLYVLGISLNDLLDEWRAYLDDTYKTDALGVEMPDEVIMKKKTRKKKTYYGFKADPTGRYYTYATNVKGKTKLYLYDIERNKRKKIFKFGIKLDRPPHYLYPRIAWHPTGEIVSYVYQKKGDILLNFYEIEEKKKTRRRIFLMEDILDISYAKNGKQMVFSGVYEGQSDIYLYNIPGNTQKKITDDRFDDLSPIFINDSKEILFSSNRNTLELEPEDAEIDTSSLQRDLFVYKIGRYTKEFRQVTNSPNVSEENPIEYRNGDIYYLSDENGTKNVYKTRYDSAIASIDTSIHYKYFYTKEEMSSFKRNILEFTSTGVEGEEAFLYYQDGRYQFKGGSLKFEPEELSEDEDDGEEYVIDEKNKYEKFDVVYLDDKSNAGEINIRDYQFNEKESTRLTYEKEVIVFDREDEEINVGEQQFVLPQQRNYNLSFFRDKSVLQLNNTYLNQQYQKYNPPYRVPGIGASFILGIADLFEDHKIYGGVRVGTESHEYFLTYHNLKKRLDKIYYAGIINFNSEEGGFNYKNRTTYGGIKLKYPFTEVSGVHMELTGRREKATPEARDQTSLEADIINDYWGSAKLSYVYDNTRNKGINLRNGTRYKLWAEYFQQLNNEEVNMEVVGLDIRHYQKIHRNLIFFMRLAGSSSFGNGKLVYYLGGVDNWMSGNTWNSDQAIDPDNEQNYQFQAIGTNMRGFRQNIRNGNSFAVVNSELRWPVIKYFVSKPLKSSFLNNFQVMGFGDVGTAWTGSDPWSEDNDQIKEEINQGTTLRIVVKKSNEPIVAGYGFGLRSTVLGYFVRVDWAWGVENGIVKDRMMYFSLSLDL